MLTGNEIQNRFLGGQLQLEFVEDNFIIRGLIDHIRSGDEEGSILIYLLWTAEQQAPGKFTWHSSIPYTIHGMNLSYYTQQTDTDEVPIFQSLDGKERVAFFPRNHPELLDESTITYT